MTVNDTVWRTLARSGPWAVLAGVLIAYHLLSLDPKLDELTKGQVVIRAQMNEARTEASADAKALLNVMGQILMSSERTVYLQMISCQIAAKNSSELRECAKGYQ